MRLSTYYQKHLTLLDLEVKEDDFDYRFCVKSDIKSHHWRGQKQGWDGRQMILSNKDESISRIQ